MYLTHNQEKSVVAKRFITNLKTKIYKHMTAVSKNVYTDKLDNVNDNAYIHPSKEVKVKNLNFKVGDHVRISKHKNIFAKGYTPN